jgi:flagellar biosynthesis/type III secretory pathway protein FliH
LQQTLERWGSLIRALYQSESGGEALSHIFRYLSLVVDDLDPQALLATTAPTAPEATETFMTTLAERWKAEGRTEGKLEGRTEGKLEGRTEGKLEGRTEGKLEGRAEGARRMLFHQLEFKFGELSSADRARIEAASEEQLLQWTTRALSADSILAVFAD